jgi:hypothetical protein
VKLHSDLREFVELLNSHGVEYLVVGGLESLLQNKRASGRPKDLADVDKLQRIQRERRD